MFLSVVYDGYLCNPCLQRGQHDMILSHWSTHFRWNKWEQGNCLTSSLSLYLAKQMQHSCGFSQHHNISSIWNIKVKIKMLQILYDDNVTYWIIIDQSLSGLRVIGKVQVGVSTFVSPTWDFWDLIIWCPSSRGAHAHVVSKEGAHQWHTTTQQQKQKKRERVAYCIPAK